MPSRSTPPSHTISLSPSYSTMDLEMNQLSHNGDHPGDLSDANHNTNCQAKKNVSDFTSLLLIFFSLIG